MKKNLLAYSLLVGLLLSSCISDGDNGGTTPVAIDISVVNLALLDLNNNGVSSDLRVSFAPSENETFVEEYRVFIVKASRVSQLSKQDIEALGSNRYQVIDPIDAAVKEFINTGMTDAEGQVIEEGISYQAVVMAVADGNNVQENQLSYSNAVTLVQESFLEIITELPIGSGGLELDEQGNVYLGDLGETLSGDPGETVYKLAPDGTQSIFASGIVGASGNTFGPDGNFYQSNIKGGKVSKILSDGSKTDYATGMSSPQGLVFDNDGNLYVANCGDNSVKKVTPQGEVSTFADGSLFSCPIGMTIDENQNIYVSNFSNEDVIAITPQGESSVLGSFDGGNNGHLTYFDGNLYVIARAAHQVYKLGLDGSIDLLVGNGERAHSEGAIDNVSLSLPYDLQFSSDGKYLYINDVKPTIGAPAESALQPIYLKRLTLLQE